MINNLEVEYKILLSEEQFYQLLNCYPKQTFIQQINTYYDTKDFTLRNKKCAMRIREREGKFLYTCKTPEKTGHMEYETFVSSNTVEALDIPEIQQLLHNLGVNQSVFPFATCSTYRAVIQLENAELCFDINDYNGIRDYEIEYECTVPHNGIQKFNEILSHVGLFYTSNCKSKIARTMETQ